MLAWMSIAAAVCFGASCVEDSSTLKQARAVKRGDTRAHALLLLGAPDDNQSEDDDEILQYCKSPPVVAGDSSEYTLVWLYKGEVTGVTTYRRAFTGATPCVAGFKAVHWEDAPARITGRREP
jgi:hypothetical protein